jgi:uncharacterized protein YukE
MAEAAAPIRGDDGDTEDEAEEGGDNVESDPGTEEEGEEEEEVQGACRRFRGLTFKRKGVNQKNVFLAVRYLNGRIPELLQGDVMEFSTSKNGRCFKMLARELSESEPTLRGVTGSALHTMYLRIVKLSTELALVLTTETGGRWTPTRLSDLAEELAALDETYNTMKKKETQQKQDDRQRQAAEVAALNEDAVGSVMMTGVEYRARQRAMENQRQQQQQQKRLDYIEGNVDPLDPSNPIPPQSATGSSVSAPTHSTKHAQSIVVRPSAPRSTSSTTASRQPASPALVRHNSATASNYSSTSASGFGVASFQLTYHQLNNNYSELQRVVLTTVEKLKERIDVMESSIHGQSNNTRISLDSLHQRLLHGEKTIGHLGEVVGSLQKDARATTSAVDTIQGTVKLLRMDFNGISTSSNNRFDTIQTHLTDLRETLSSQKRRLDEVLNDIDDIKRTCLSSRLPPPIPSAPMGNNMPHSYDFAHSSSNSSNFSQFSHNSSSNSNSNSSAIPISHNNSENNDLFVPWHPNEATYGYKKDRKK